VALSARTVQPAGALNVTPAPVFCPVSAVSGVESEACARREQAEEITINIENKQLLIREAIRAIILRHQQGGQIEIRLGCRESQDEKELE
jgi:hypothetical protein